MAKIALDLTQFKSAGVYTVEIDNSERIVVTTQSLRLVPGFSALGPFNTPVFIRSTRDLEKFYGVLDSKLERKGSFFHRSIKTCLLTSPVFAISLLKTDASTLDTVDIIGLQIDSNSAPVDSSTDLFVNLFNRQRFWTPDSDFLQSAIVAHTAATNAYNAPLLQLGNVGTKTVSFIVRKAQDVNQYKTYAIDWYSGAANIPYQWIRPYDYIADYFIQIVAIEGDWTDYSRLSTDPYYSQFFTADGIIPAQLNNFMNAGQINLMASWTGTIIPDFIDKTGVEQYIESIVNSATPITGILLNVNQQALDQLQWNATTSVWQTLNPTTGLYVTAINVVDLVGHELSDQSTNISTSFMSYTINVSNNVLHTDVSIFAWPEGDTTGRSFRMDASTEATEVTVGTLITKKGGTGIIPGLTYVTQKYYDPSGYIIHTAEEVSVGRVTVQKTIDDPSIASVYKFIPLTGLTLTNKHLPGFSITGAADAEAGVSKIYSMLADSGIERGLINVDMINYRYIVDTMAYGLAADMGGKSYLSALAKLRGKCTAILNAPAISQFAQSQDPYFCDTFIEGGIIPAFSTEWIPAGGNPDMPRSFRFSLPNEQLGAKYCGVFGPYLKYNENGRLMDVPPAADVANAYVKKFLGGNPFAIVANRNGVLVNPNLVGVEFMIDKTDRDYLEPFGYNSIIERSSTGQTMIYSNATAYQDLKTEFNNLHVRELLNSIEIQVEEVLKNYIFDFNNPVTRLNIINSITPILETTKDAGALTKYDVVMDETNNPAELIAEGFGIIDINVWITGGLTKIINRITVNSNSGISTGGFVF